MIPFSGANESSEWDVTGMGIGIFADKEHKPTMEEILRSIGAKRKLWEKLALLIAEKYRIKSDMTFYGKNYGWGMRYRKGRKALLSMYPGKGSFTVQFVLSRALARGASNLRLGKNTRKVLESAHEFPQGRWLFIGIESERDISDIQSLLALKARPSKNK